MTTKPAARPTTPQPRPAPPERPVVAPSTQTADFSFPQLVADELSRARRAHPNRFVDLHQASSVIREEFEEFWDEVKRKVADPEYVLTELKQMAAMIQRTAEDLELVVNRYA